MSRNDKDIAEAIRLLEMALHIRQRALGETIHLLVKHGDVFQWHMRKGIDLLTHRAPGGAEIDLILEGQFGNANFLPVEIKLTQQPDKRALRSLSEFVVAHDCPLGLVINNDERPRRLDERILSIPVDSL